MHALNVSYNSNHEVSYQLNKKKDKNMKTIVILYDITDTIVKLLIKG